ncbi:Aste57867_20569 [Aphanomyces stellatus]|uniref:Aste57867_20569 protein n=1 Tax=Aphanomyces stellatus TaxID=120398 RepID=A0A485LF76_9STRA|nr:hypothetical protein As57867_020502 [Aphanomyces stellatus]VFT97252.1 Aste57867_20569 [Aphanomyces stellatus]
MKHRLVPATFTILNLIGQNAIKAIISANPNRPSNKGTKNKNSAEEDETTADGGAMSKVNKQGEVIIKSGVLFKKGSGMGLLQRKNWKPRYFELTQHALRYFTFQDGEMKGEINLKMCGEDTLEIMPADSMKTGGSASTIWRIAINTTERRLLVAAGTETEMNGWIDAFLEIFRANTTGRHTPTTTPVQKMRHSLPNHSEMSSDRNSASSSTSSSNRHSHSGAYVADNFMIPPPPHARKEAEVARGGNVSAAQPKSVADHYDGQGGYAF